MLLVVMTAETAGLGLWEQPLAAGLGGAAAALFIYRLSIRRGRTSSTYTLVLNGIAVTAGLHAVQMLIVVGLDPNKFHSVNTWLIGSIFGNSWTHVHVLACIVFFSMLFFLAHHETLDILALREETAIGGSIGFIGLICPHIARRRVGVSHRWYLPMTALLGAILLVAADWFARIVIAPDEMLVGLVVSLIGAPYFLYILARSKG